MEKRNFWIIALVAIITIGIIGCGGDDTPETFNVTFIANGGTPEPQTQKINKGGKVSEPSISKANNTLDGWYKESTFSTKWGFANDIVNANVTLHAQWAFVQPDTTMPLGFGTGCKVTVKSDEKFTSNEWSTLCVKVVTAIMRGYNAIDEKWLFEGEFTDDFGGISIVLLKSATYDIEIKNAGDRVIYIKTSALDTVDIQPAIWAIGDMEAYHN